MTREPETLNVSFRLLDNEVIGLEISSESPRKNWILIGSLILVLLSWSAHMLVPVIQALFGG